jgi:hypothetical protein
MYMSKENKDWPTFFVVEVIENSDYLLVHRQGNAWTPGL